MLALIDGDIVAHRVAWTTVNDPVGIAKYRADEMVDGILRDTSANEFRIFLSDSRRENFRWKIYTLYKANRTQEPPPHLTALKEHLLTKWNAEITLGMEADDALGIEGRAINPRDASDYKPMHTRVICSIDKDLKQIPGMHYNFVKKEFDEVTPVRGLFEFYKQLLTGDTTDNIPGCPGIGPVKADQALREASTEDEMFDICYRTYWTQLKKKEFADAHPQVLDSIVRSFLLLSGRLLKIKQEANEDLWHFPQSVAVMEQSALFTQPLVVDYILSTEPT